LLKFNEGLIQELQINEIGELFKSKCPIVNDKVGNLANDLGGLTYNDLMIIGYYKRKRNAMVHKEKCNKSTTYTKFIALSRLEIVGRRMALNCKAAIIFIFISQSELSYNTNYLETTKIVTMII
jgi:hypothetical protein